MNIKLAEFPKVRYTMMEFHLFKSLPKSGRKVGSAEIARAREKLGNWDIKHQLNTITTTMNRLMDKVETNGEPFRIMKDGKRTGHHEVEYWVEIRKKRNGK